MNPLPAFSHLCLRELRMVLFTGDDVPDGDLRDGEVQGDDGIAGALCGIGRSASARSWKQGQVSASTVSNF